MNSEQSYTADCYTYALTESNVRTIVNGHASLFASMFDHAPAYDLTDNQIRIAAGAMLSDHIEIVREIVAFGSDLDANAIKAVPRGTLIQTAAQITRQTESAFPRDYLKSVIIDELQPFSLYLSGTRH